MESSNSIKGKRTPEEYLENLLERACQYNLMDKDTMSAVLQQETTQDCEYDCVMLALRMTLQNLAILQWRPLVFAAENVPIKQW